MKLVRLKHLSGTALAAVMFAAALSQAAANGDDEGSRRDEQHALSGWQSLVGQWRGVGQPRRGSTAGAWTEEADWRWSFTREHAALEFAAPDSKMFVSGRLTSTDDDAFELTARASKDAQPVTFAGRRDAEGNLVLLRENAPGQEPARITIRTVAGGDRLAMLVERLIARDRYVRVAEIGYTRQGSGFGQGSTQPECVVTGGSGTIEVRHNGQSYYVCCSGCREAFEADPEGILAEYRQRKAAE